jgi:hypothetical protein
MILEKVYLINHDQMNQLPDRSEYIVMDSAYVKMAIVAMCERYGRRAANMHAPSDVMLGWLPTVDIREKEWV